MVFDPTFQKISSEEEQLPGVDEGDDAAPFDETDAADLPPEGAE